MNIFLGWILFWGEYFSGVNIFQVKIFFEGWIFFSHSHSLNIWLSLNILGLVFSASSIFCEKIMRKIYFRWFQTQTKRKIPDVGKYKMCGFQTTFSEVVQRLVSRNSNARTSKFFIKEKSMCFLRTWRCTFISNWQPQVWKKICIYLNGSLCLVMVGGHIILYCFSSCYTSAFNHTKLNDLIPNINEYWFIFSLSVLRENPFTFMYSAFGHCPNSNWTHPPALNRQCPNAEYMKVKG